jgi:pimeloyl-ACP methyl ester carboxylesterase
MKIFRLTLISILSLPLLWSCQAPEKSKTENPMDSPEIQRMLFHPRRVMRTDLPTGAEDIDIEVEPGVKIGCRLFTADKEKPTILFFHGNGEIVSDYDLIGPVYARHNLNLLVTDYRGYGWSDGSPSFSNLLADSHVLYARLKQFLLDNGYSPTLFIMGRSLGSAAAIELAEAYNDEISGLIIESGFADTLPLAETLGADLTKTDITEEQTFNNGGKIKNVTKPTFLLHGQLDILIPLWQAESCTPRAEPVQKNFRLCRVLIIIL